MTITNAATDRAARVHNNGGSFLCFFGRIDRDGRFVCSYAKPARTYKTEKGANRAAAKWTA
jgi:hypothetical protein